MNIQSTEPIFTENILLLGAGFTKNFGGLLADEMWAHIFNHEKVQAQSRVKMLNDFDYESIYYSVLEDPLVSYCEKEAIKEATKLAYDNIDKIIIEYAERHSQLRGFYNVDDFIRCFPPHDQEIKDPNDGKIYHRLPDENNKSFIFTLNQDLFFERVYPNLGYPKLFIPGIKNNSEWFTFPTTFNNPLTPSDYCRLPNEDELTNKNILLDGNYFLIKLHGSYNWTSFDGSDIMVIGRGKKEQIQKEPLLKRYSEIFKKALSQSQHRLLIIGYGFGDDHINRIISDAVKYHLLKIYILSPETPEKLKNKLYGRSKELKKQSYDRFEDPINIWKGISGYFQCMDILLGDDREHQTMKKYFNDVFFGRDK
jgi:hypothetical protein